MKIKKVDDKPMVIHTHEPKKASIKAANIYTVDRSPKIKGAKIATTENKKFWGNITLICIIKPTLKRYTKNKV